MTIRRRPTSVAITCDVPGCHSEVLGPTEDEVLSDAQLVGWKFMDEQHVCIECQRGKSTATARTIGRYGDKEATIPAATMRYAKGDPVYVDGRQVGHAKADTDAGQPLTVVLPAPEVKEYRGEQVVGAKPRLSATAPDSEPVKKSLFEDVDTILSDTTWDPGDN